MGFIHDTGYGPAYEHEGVAYTVLADGTLTATYPAGEQRDYRGWRAGCSCGWVGSDYPREQWGTGSILPPEAVDDAASDEWDEHLYAALPELAVYELRTEESWQRTCLGAAVVRARDAGVSWARIADAAGMSRQAAHERWGGIDEAPARLPEPEPSPSATHHAAQQARRRANARLLRTAADALAAAGPRDPAAWLHQRADTIVFGQQSI